MPSMFYRWVLVLLVGFSLAATLPATTGMVAVQIECGQAVLSPQGLQRARQLAADIESTFLDRLFEEGHIGFNAPAEIHLLGTSPALTTVENLLSQTSLGGGELMILCRLEITEPIANQALAVLSATVSAVPISLAEGRPQTWVLPLTPGQTNLDTIEGMAKVAKQAVARVGEFKESALALRRGG